MCHCPSLKRPTTKHESRLHCPNCGSVGLTHISRSGQSCAESVGVRRRFSLDTCPADWKCGDCGCIFPDPKYLEAAVRTRRKFLQAGLCLVVLLTFASVFCCFAVGFGIVLFLLDPLILVIVCVLLRVEKRMAEAEETCAYLNKNCF